jgi:hypothetical protein
MGPMRFWLDLPPLIWVARLKYFEAANRLEKADDKRRAANGFVFFGRAGHNVDAVYSLLCCNRAACFEDAPVSSIRGVL